MRQGCGVLDEGREVDDISVPVITIGWCLVAEGAAAKEVRPRRLTAASHPEDAAGGVGGCVRRRHDRHVVGIRVVGSAQAMLQAKK